MKKWSISAHNCFQRCQRQYFFRHIMAHHNAKDEKRREAYLRKQLSSLDAWRGRLVHSALERYFVTSLQQGKVINCKELTQKTLDLAERQLEFSRQQKYSQAGITKTKAGDSYLALKVHEDTIEIEQQEIEIVFEDIKQCYQNLYDHQKFMDFLTNQADWYETEFRLSFKFDGVTIIGQPDLLVGYGDNICVIDWKTGKSKTADYSQQLYLYGLAVIKNYRWTNFDLSDLLLIEANLLQNKFTKHSIDKSQKIEMEELIDRSISDIQATTKDHKYNLNQLDNYDYAENPVSCRYCNFVSLCKSIKNQPKKRADISHPNRINK